MTTYDDVATRWVENVRGAGKRNLKVQRMFADRDTLYSYGYHFPLAEAVRDKAGEVVLFLLNGDRYSVTTSRHQSIVRGVVGRRSTSAIILPFSALSAADIQRNTVRALDITPDQWTTEEVVTYNKPRAAWIDFTEETRDGQTVYRYTRNTHHLGESLFEAEVRTTKTVRCRPCKGRGRLDDGTAVASAIDWCEKCNGRGHKTVWVVRTAKFLSAFDTQESQPLYFLCELPQTDATTVAEAREALKPETVKLAESLDRPVIRQGDIFAVQVPTLTLREIRKMGARVEKRQRAQRAPSPTANLLGTNHEASEVAYLPDGRTLARGLIYHAPQWRRPDHARRRLAPGWNVIIKNTVPVGG